MEYFGAIDQGTTSSRFIIFDQDRNLVASHQIEFEQLLPKPGYVEHDPEEIWNGADKLFSALQNKNSWISALGALSGNQAVQMVKAGLKAIYLRSTILD